MLDHGGRCASLSSISHPCTDSSPAGVPRRSAERGARKVCRSSLGRRSHTAARPGRSVGLRAARCTGTTGNRYRYRYRCRYRLPVGTGRPVGALARWDSHCSVHGAVGDNGVRSQVRGSTENMMSRTVQINKHIVRRRRRQPSAVEPSGAAGARGGRRAARRGAGVTVSRPPRVHRRVRERAETVRVTQ